MVHVHTCLKNTRSIVKHRTLHENLSVAQSQFGIQFTYGLLGMVLNKLNYIEFTFYTCYQTVGKKPFQGTHQ